MKSNSQEIFMADVVLVRMLFPLAGLGVIAWGILPRLQINVPAGAKNTTETFIYLGLGLVVLAVSKLLWHGPSGRRHAYESERQGHQSPRR